MAQATDPYAPLWCTRLANATGADRLARALGRPALAPYLFVSALLVLDGVVLSTVTTLYIDRAHPLLTDPFWYAAPVGLWFAVWSIRSLARGHDRLVSTYDFDQQFAAPDVTAESVYDLRTTRLKHVVFGLLLVAHAATYLLLGEWTAVVRMDGTVVGFLKFGFIIPFGYFPVIAEFAGLVLATLVVLPRYVVTKEYRLQFDDPLDTGGLEPVGDLIKRATYIYAVGLLFAIAFEYGSAASSTFDPTASPSTTFHTAEFVVVWAVGVVLVLYATFTLHAYMQRKKLAKIRELDAEIREFGDDDRGFPETDPADPEYPRLEYEYLRLQKVKDTSTFPFTPATEERVVVSAVVPLALELLINVLV
ncbi:hypothetical protein SAMN04488065_2118 [Haloplanus vescus]|uniref:Uncharacterized protein n=1 Tax=Haloplanus vescus TaxID=555874 RepID=A0A1H3Z3L5_9EURY|nr:hypothetical protein [Haloplanus vescus]SEA18068.1 hypothetical protein SAMN04488065_2118 [Haloplanus vescus]